MSTILRTSYTPRAHREIREMLSSEKIANPMHKFAAHQRESLYLLLQTHDLNIQIPHVRTEYVHTQYSHSYMFAHNEIVAPSFSHANMEHTPNNSHQPILPPTQVKEKARISRLIPRIMPNFTHLIFNELITLALEL
jgi:hypothetical protein